MGVDIVVAEGCLFHPRVKSISLALRGNRVAHSLYLAARLGKTNLPRLSFFNPS